MDYMTKNGLIKVFTDNIDQTTISQVYNMANSPLGEGADIRIMPDCHAGKGCVIGTTMKVIDKVCPNVVGVDIGCGVTFVKTDADFSQRLEELDDVISKYVPSGFAVHQNSTELKWLKDLKCFDALDDTAIDRVYKSLGTLGGGNHFIEAYNDGGLAVHSGSRNLGKTVADIYQRIAQSYIQESGTGKELAYLIGEDMQNYLHDIKLIQLFACENRKKILTIICDKMGIKSVEPSIDTIHNYIDTDTMILRKGAVRADLGELLVIPLNMRDGMLICRGKGNEDWNNSAPHGAGRLYSRAQAKATFSLEAFKETMEGVYSTSIVQQTLDEAPFAYKDYEEIMTNIQDTVEIIERIIPIYNYKAH